MPPSNSHTARLEADTPRQKITSGILTAQDVLKSPLQFHVWHTVTTEVLYPLCGHIKVKDRPTP